MFKTSLTYVLAAGLLLGSALQGRAHAGDLDWRNGTHVNGIIKNALTPNGSFNGTTAGTSFAIERIELPASR
jgi:hypothetical protein